jgi:hypothetical protein
VKGFATLSNVFKVGSAGSVSVANHAAYAWFDHKAALSLIALSRICINDASFARRFSLL